MNQLIHVPKTGGFAMCTFLAHHFPGHFELMGHEFRTKDSENPIVTIRNPIERVESAYQYLTKGSEIFDLNERMTFWEFLAVAEELMGSIRPDEHDLLSKYPTTIHSLPQAYWINREDYSKTIVIIYQKDLNESVFELLRILDLPEPTERLPTLNATRNKKPMRFSGHELKKIMDLYVSDFALWHEIVHNPNKSNPEAWALGSFSLPMVLS